MRDKVPILLYHSIFKQIPQEFPAASIHNVSPTDFEDQIIWLKQKYTIVPLGSIFSIQDKVKHICAITFDDAYKNVFENTPFL